MGQIETKDEQNKNQKSGDEENTRSIGNNVLNDVNIKIPETYDKNKDVESEKKDEDKDQLKMIQNVNACDFGCMIFFTMVAMLIFSTLGRSYSSYSGGSCGALYAAQPFLAYTCIGFACVIIRRLRKQIREQVRPSPEFLTHFNLGNEPNIDVNGYEIFKDPLKDNFNDDKPDQNHGISNETKPKIGDSVTNLPLTESIAFIQPSEEKKNSSLLPLPLLPPPKSKRRSTQTESQTQNMSVLSAIDLTSINTTVTSDTKPMIESNIGVNTVLSNNLNGIDVNQFDSFNDCPKNGILFWDSYDLNDKKH